MGEPRKGGEIPRLHYAISKLHIFQDCVKHIHFSKPKYKKTMGGGEYQTSGM